MHRRGTRLSLALATVDPRFRTHLESGPPENDILGPGLQERQAYFSLAVSRVRLRGVGCRQSLTHANQVSRGETVDLERNDGVLENAGLSVSEDQHILPTDSALKLAQLVCSISGPGDEELSQLTNSVTLLHFEGSSGAHPSPRLVDISVLSTGVLCVRHKLLLMQHGKPLVQLVQHPIKSSTSSSSDNKITHGETQELRSHTKQFRSTNWSLTDPGVDFSPPSPQSDKKTLADVPWPE